MLTGLALPNKPLVAWRILREPADTKNTTMNAQIRLSGLCLATALALSACSKQPSAVDTSGEPQDPTDQLPARFKTQEPVTKPDFRTAGMSPAFQKAIKDATAILGAKPQPLLSQAEDEQIIGGACFAVPQEKIEAILFKAHTNFLARGFYLFRCDQNFGIADRPDLVGLLPTTNKFDVMAAMDTNGDNYSIGTAGVIAWMKELEQEQPYVLTGIGFDYMEGRFTAPAKDPDALAQRMYQFCPDIVDQGVETVDKLANELRKGALYFWWD
jgi:hypothetical protein